MKQKFRILRGNTKDVENELNELSKEYLINIQGMSATNETTTIVLDLFDNRY